VKRFERVGKTVDKATCIKSVGAVTGINIPKYSSSNTLSTINLEYEMITAPLSVTSIKGKQRLSNEMIFFQT
jgi:hypothetical protein